MSLSSKVVTANVQVGVEKRSLYSIFCSDLGTSGTLTLHNGTSASDPALFGPFDLANGTQHFNSDIGVQFNNGIYAVVTGSPTVTINYA